MNNHTGTKAKLKERIVCKQCCNVFENKLKTIKAECPNCGKVIDARDRRGYYEQWSKKHPDKAAKRLEAMKKHEDLNRKIRSKKMRERIRLSNFNIVSKNNPVCANCGCNDVRLLEINHINGGGTKELQDGKRTNQFAWDIYMLRRKTDDLNLLCRVCNSLHYHELIYGKLPYKILYDKN